MLEPVSNMTSNISNTQENLSSPFSGCSLTIDRVSPYSVIGRPITLHVSLKNDKNNLIYHPCKLKVVAFFEDNNEPQEIEVEDGASDISLNENGQKDINVKLLKLSKDEDSFTVRKTIIRVTGVVNNEELWQVDTIPIVCVRHRLIIEDDINKNYEKPVVKNRADEGRVKNVFFKDKGGKDKGIEIIVKLVDENDQLVIGRDILLKLVLYYADGEPVQDQTILHINNDNRGGLMLNNGIARIKFRINQVSTKHCDREFAIHVISGVTDDMGVSDIAPAIGVPILVLSKTNNKHPPKTSSPPVNTQIPLKNSLYEFSNTLSALNGQANSLNSQPLKRMKLNPTAGFSSEQVDINRLFLEQFNEARLVIQAWSQKAIECMLLTSNSNPVDPLNRIREELVNQYNHQFVEKLNFLENYSLKIQKSIESTPSLPNSTIPPTTNMPSITPTSSINSNNYPLSFTPKIKLENSSNLMNLGMNQLNGLNFNALANQQLNFNSRDDIFRFNNIQNLLRQNANLSLLNSNLSSLTPDQLNTVLNTVRQHQSGLKGGEDQQKQQSQGMNDAANVLLALAKKD